MALLKGVKDTLQLPLTADLPLDGGKSETVKFSATYRVPPVSEAQEVVNQAAAGDLTDREIVDTYLVGWDMPGDDGTAVPFSEEAVNEAMEYWPYRTALVNGFMTVALGREAVRSKN